MESDLAKVTMLINDRTGLVFGSTQCINDPSTQCINVAGLDPVPENHLYQ